jgi:hypothetical protein
VITSRTQIVQRGKRLIRACEHGDHPHCILSRSSSGTSLISTTVSASHKGRGKSMQPSLMQRLFFFERGALACCTVKRGSSSRTQNPHCQGAWMICWPSSKKGPCSRTRDRSRARAAPHCVAAAERDRVLSSLLHHNVVFNRVSSPLKPLDGEDDRSRRIATAFMGHWAATTCVPIVRRALHITDLGKLQDPPPCFGSDEEFGDSRNSSAGCAKKKVQEGLRRE